MNWIAIYAKLDFIHKMEIPSMGYVFHVRSDLLLQQLNHQNAIFVPTDTTYKIRAALSVKLAFMQIQQI